MKETRQKYEAFGQINMPERKWPTRTIEKAPIWCSVDLRDGNQALINPMNIEQKIEFFKMLVDIGFKEIEVGFPSASETEFQFLREIIEKDMIPDDVWVQVLVQSREHLIRKTFEAVKGAKNVIIHFYNSTSKLQREVVFKMEQDGITDIAVKGAELIRDLTAECIASGDKTNFRFEYSPESFSGTEPDFAVNICEAVLDTLGATKDNKVIINLPNTVELATPNVFADQIEYFCTHVKDRERIIVSVHPHNDRGTGIACAEMSLLAGADRIEGTLFGNGERTGNLDIVTMALNMHTQGIDMNLDFSNINKIREVYESNTEMTVHDRHPYAGKLAFTAFSGSHQDAINKGHKYMKDTHSSVWKIPYLPIDPADVGREYEPIVRINSQSGKGGAAFVMQSVFGYELPKKMQSEFGVYVQTACENVGRELNPNEVYSIFEEQYLKVDKPYKLLSYKFFEESADSVDGDFSDDDTVTRFNGKVSFNDETFELDNVGNGPINAFCMALNTLGLDKYQFVGYSEHAISVGSDAKAVAYIEIKSPENKSIFGVGIGNNINVASARGILCAVNRAIKQS